VLLTVSGRIPADLDDRIERGETPRPDYVVLQEALGADLVDVERALRSSRWLGRLLLRLGGAGPLLAWFCFRHRRAYDLILSDGEQVGLPFALLCRLFGRGTARHMMIVHIISTRAKVALIRWCRLADLIDRYVVYCAWQGDFAERRLGVPGDRVSQSTFMVDSVFFDPAKVDVAQRPMICSAGLERRDYETLIRAVADLDIDVVIAAASPWSRQADSTTGRELPHNVEIRRLDLFELRRLYAAAQVVVMPLHEVNFQAGITTILEAMSMARPLICTRTPGQTDTIVDDVTGRYVGSGDSDELRATITALIGSSDEARRIGDNARRWVVEHADIEVYA
jgi:glycosyltransferase involved in cell wall biosynthesis